MYFEHYGRHYAAARQQELLAEANQARLHRLARAARQAQKGSPPGSTSSVHRLWRRAALWLGTHLVHWGEALQVRAVQRDNASEPAPLW